MRRRMEDDECGRRKESGRAEEKDCIANGGRRREPGQAEQRPVAGLGLVLTENGGCAMASEVTSRCWE